MNSRSSNDKHKNQTKGRKVISQIIEVIIILKIPDGQKSLGMYPTAKQITDIANMGNSIVLIQYLADMPTRCLANQTRPHAQTVIVAKSEKPTA